MRSFGKFSLFFFSVFLFTAANSHAAVFTANTSNDPDCSDGTGGLQACLDEAVDNGEDDTIQLESGTYDTAPYTYNAAISGEDADLILASLTVGGAVIDGLDADQGMDIITSGVGDTNTEIEVDGLVFTGGTSGNGGGLQVSTVDADVVITNSQFNGNNATLGGGLDVQSSATGNITIDANTFTGNIAASAGGGIFFSVNTGTATIENNVFTGNQANIFGGAAFSAQAEASGGSIIVVNNVSFTAISPWATAEASTSSLRTNRNPRS